MSRFPLWIRTRTRIFEEELVQLRATLENERAEINVSINQIEYMSGPDADEVAALNKWHALRRRITKSQACALSAESELEESP